jgi:hypothetical protein
MITAAATERPTTDTSSAWRQTVRAVLDEGDGLLRLAIITPTAIDPLLEAARTGDAEALRLCAIIDRLSLRLDAIDTASNTAPTCLLCQTSIFRRSSYPAAVTIVNAATDAPDATLVTGVCAACCRVLPSPELLQSAIVDSLCRSFALHLRLLPSFAAAVGHA